MRESIMLFAGFVFLLLSIVSGYIGYDAFKDRERVGGFLFCILTGTLIFGGLIFLNIIQ